MKEWWINLSLREKQYVSLGTVAVLILLFYSLIWSPLSNKVISMRGQIQRNEQLLAWIQTADKQIQLVEKNLQQSASSSSTSLLSTTQNLINESTLSSQLSQLRQADSDSVQLSFKQVDFDKLIAWLAETSKTQRFVVSQLTVTPSPSPGIVSAELTLKSS